MTSSGYNNSGMAARFNSESDARKILLAPGITKSDPKAKAFMAMVSRTLAHADQARFT